MAHRWRPRLTGVPFDVALVAVGIALLYLGGEVLVRGAVALAAHLGVRPAVIGLTVVAVGTSAPELGVSLLAAARGSADLAVANVIGSNLFNTGVILGVSAVITPLAVHYTAVRQEWPVLLVATCGSILALQDGRVGRVEGLLLVVFLAAFTAWLVRAARHGLPHEADEAAKDSLPPEDRWTASLRGAMAVSFAGLLLLGVGAQVLVEGAVDLATAASIPERVIGLTIVAAGTSMPELAASLAAARRGESDIALANVLGSNLFNLAGILGFVAVLVPQHVAPAVIAVDVWWLLGFTLALFPVMVSGWRVSRVEGVLLLGAYLVYLGLLLA